VDCGCGHRLGWSPDRHRRQDHSPQPGHCQRQGCDSHGQRVVWSQSDGPGSTGHRRQEQRDHGHPRTAELLDISGAVVTIDAAGCQKKIAECIVEHGGHYILQLKGNQGSLHEETTMLFDQCLTDDCHGIAYSTATTVEKGHGRIEERRIWATTEVNWFAEKGKWKNLRSLIRVQAKRTVGPKTSTEYRYYISDLAADNASGLLAYIRGHWGVENSLHWSLDINFREDDRRIRQGHAAENFARLSRIALNLLKAEKTNDGGIKTKRLCCGWDHDYLLKVLTAGV